MRNPDPGATPARTPAILGRVESFDTTRWSRVIAAGRRSSPESAEALSLLCRTYWHPLHAYVRGRVSDPDEAQDLTQEFFARLLEKNVIAQADGERGRFRSFLLAALKHFLANEWDKARADKRGGDRRALSFDPDQTECVVEPSDSVTPEQLYERQWAVTLLERVLHRLRADFTSRGEDERFEQLKPMLLAADDRIAYADVAAKLGTSEGAARMAVHRMRRRYRELLREEVGHTVADPAEIDDEISGLFAALAVPAAEENPKPSDAS